MANFEYTAKSSFKPFTFEEMLRPLAMYTELYNAIEEDIAELGSKADLMRMYANEEPDSRVANMYNKYANDLDLLAESLAKQGLSPSSRQGLLDLKRRYSSEITPIELAVEYRKKLSEELRKAIMSNPSLMFDRYFSLAKLLDIIDNPELGYTPVSGNELYARGAAAAKATSLRNLSFDQKKVLGDQYWQLTKRLGYTSQLAAKWLADEFDIPELDSAIERIKAESNTSILNPTDLLRADNFIIDGIMSQLTYDEDRSYQANKQYDYEMRDWLERQKEERDAERKGKEDKTPKVNMDRLTGGAEGTVSEAVKRLEGLRRTDSGYSTTALDRVYIPYQKAKKDLDSFEAANPELKAPYDEYQEKLDDWNARMQRLEEQQRTNPSPKLASAKLVLIQNKPKFEGDVIKFSEYNKLRQAYDKVTDPYNQELEYLSEIESKYSHLGRDSYEAMLVGMQLEDRQEKEANYPLILNYAKESDYNNARDRMTNLMGSFNEQQLKGVAGLYELDSEGNTSKLSLEDMNAIMNDDDNPIRFKVDTGKDPKLVIIHNNKDYVVKGSQRINTINKNLKAVNEYLKDFSSLGTEKSLNNTTFIDDSNRRDFISGNVTNLKTFQIPNSDYRGAIVYDRQTNSWVKYILNNKNEILGANSLLEELRGGELRDLFIINMAGMALLTN